MQNGSIPGSNAGNPMLTQGQMTPEQQKAWEQLMLLLGGLGPTVPTVNPMQPRPPIMGGIRG